MWLLRVEKADNEQPLHTFAGTQITEKQDMLYIDQDLYLNKIYQTPNKVEFNTPASMRLKSEWKAYTRPDLTFEISQIAQMTRTMFQQDLSKHCKILSKAIESVHDNRASMRIPKLDLDTLCTATYSDAAFGNNIDLSTQLGK